VTSRRSPWGWITALAGTVVALIAAFWPVSLSILGTTASCGPAAVALFGPGGGSSFEDEVASQCHAQALSPAGIGVVVLAGSWIAFAVSKTRSDRAESPQRQADLYLRAAIDRLHSPHQMNPSMCPSCNVMWPCPTAQAAGATARRAANQPRR
jgi:hypothetical protein